MEGWISVHRKVLDNPVVCKDSDYFYVWLYLLMNATHKEREVIFNGSKITLQPGQLITGRKLISTDTKISESKIQRILKVFENEHQIEQYTCNKNRLITILKWKEYQQGEQQTEQQLNNKRTTTEQQLNTNNNVNKGNNDKNDKENKYIVEIVDYLNYVCKSHYKNTSDKTRSLIKARMREGYTVEDFKMVIDNKANEWWGTEWDMYLRPQTLFGAKFEAYLNQRVIKTSKEGHVVNVEEYEDIPY